MATETERRAQELGNAMLNAARPYMDVDLDRQGLPVAVTQLRHATSSLSSKQLQRITIVRQP